MAQWGDFEENYDWEKHHGYDMDLDDMSEPEEDNED